MQWWKRQRPTIRETPFFTDRLSVIAPAIVTDELLNTIIEVIATALEEVRSYYEGSHIRCLDTSEVEIQGFLLPALRIWFVPSELLPKTNTPSVVLLIDVTYKYPDEFDDIITEKRDIQPHRIRGDVTLETPEGDAPPELE